MARRPGIAGLAGIGGLAALAVAVALLPGLGTPAGAGDARWRFYTADRTRYVSPWFAGGHRIMIPYGCTRAPYYSPDPRCAGRRGFHHGVDVAMACGTELYAGRRGRVLGAAAPGRPGPAYGVHPLRIRSAGRDILIGHARRVFVEPGQRLRRGQRIALASDSGAPDGCHLHFEVRRRGAGYTGAVDPSAYLRLTPRRG
jgi:murein DD-endopeptidase MepM/ murein hydrolase activator NlpD